MALTSRQTEQINHAIRGDGARFNLGTTLETALLKLDGVEALADVTDPTNVAAALAAGASGAVTPANIAGLAATASTTRVRSVLMLAFPFVAADFAANDDLVVTLPAGHAVVITDVKCHLTTVEGGACTAVLRTAANGGGTAISSALDLDATNGDMLRTTTIGGQAVAAAGSLYFHASTNPGTCAGTLYVEFLHTT
jgi:hypothetical protein